MTTTTRSTSPAGPEPYSLVWDDFSDGFSTAGPAAKWFSAAAGEYVADDGTATTSHNALHVAPGGRNPRTGTPAFGRTLVPDQAGEPGPPGTLDRVKWLVYANRRATSGAPGFDAPSGHELTFTTRLSARTFGTADHPFGDAVADPAADLRLAAAAMSVTDVETSLVVDFFLTGTRVYAVYERLPTGGAPLGDHAAFTAAVPVADRRPADEHLLSISYSKDAGTVRWLLDGTEVYRVSRLGFVPDRRYLVVDHGGPQTLARPRQLTCGLGLFTLLDAATGAGGPGLVRLSRADGFYFDPAFDPRVGEPRPQSFVDELSRPASRLFGQGAELTAKPFVVSTEPTG